MTKKNKQHEKAYRQWQKENRKALDELNVRIGVAQPKKRFVWTVQKLIAVCTSFVLLVGISVGGYFLFRPTPQVETPEKPKDEVRYCTQTEYTPNEVTTTLKEYSIQNDEKILYFDWYNQIEALSDYQYTLNDTKEVIAFKESFFNFENGYEITFYTTDNLIELEELNFYKTDCTDTTTINEVTINYAYYKGDGQSMWEYNGYKYYMESKGTPTVEDMFALIEELLQK